MLDYMVWPWIERLEALTMLHPDSAEIGKCSAWMTFANSKTQIKGFLDCRTYQIILKGSESKNICNSIQIMQILWFAKCLWLWTKKGAKLQAQHFLSEKFLKVNFQDWTSGLKTWKKILQWRITSWNLKSMQTFTKVMPKVFTTMIQKCEYSNRWFRLFGLFLLNSLTNKFMCLYFMRKMPPLIIRQ